LTLPCPSRWRTYNHPEREWELGGFAEGQIISEHACNDLPGVGTIAGQVLAIRQQVISSIDSTARMSDMCKPGYY